MLVEVSDGIGVPVGKDVKPIVRDGVIVLNPTVEVLVDKIPIVGLDVSEAVGEIVISGVSDDRLEEV